MTCAAHCAHHISNDSGQGTAKSLVFQITLASAGGASISIRMFPFAFKNNQAA